MARTLIVSDRHNSFFSANNIRVGNQIPVEGNYVKGDIIVNIGDNTASEAMWICVESGNPGIWEVVGAGAGGNGGSNFVSINNTVFVNEPVNEVELGLGVAITSKDKLIVHHNSIHLMQDVDYRIEGNKIVKLTEGNWNEDSEEAMFAFELFKNVEIVDGNLVEVKTKLVCMQNTITVNGAVNEVKIGIEGFDKDKDTLLVFENETFLTREVNYEINGNGDGIVPVGDEVWNDVMIDDWSYTFVVFKDVPLVEGEDKIGMELLSEEVKEAIEAAGNIDLNGKQDKSDEGLVTTDKTIVGAINELFQDVDSGKNIIADAIDVDGITGDSTFAAMGEAIEGKNTEILNLQTELAGKVTPAGNATADHVLQGSTFMNSSGQLQTGNIPYLHSNLGNVTENSRNHYMTSEIQVGDYSGTGGQCLYFKIPYGYYTNLHWIMSSVPDLLPENIISGKCICGVTGTAKTATGISHFDKLYAYLTFSVDAYQTGVLNIDISSYNLTYTPECAVVSIPGVRISASGGHTYTMTCGNGLLFQNEYCRAEVTSISRTNIQVTITALDQSGYYGVFISGCGSDIYTIGF